MNAYLPFDRSLGSVLVTQGIGGSTSHLSWLYNSWDFAVPYNTAVLAIADGYIVDYFDGAQDGQMGAGNSGNIITIRHDDGFYSSYFHLAPNSILASLKTEIDAGREVRVLAGEVIGKVGNTGDTTGPHIHLTVGTETIHWGNSTGHDELIANGSQTSNGTVPVSFYDVSGGIPIVGQSVTSENIEQQPQSPDSGINLISGLGGSAGFGEQLLARNDDSSTGFIDITSIFEDNINFFGREFSGLWVNNNGSVTFNGPRGAYTPNVITGISNNPEITPYFADVDTRGGQVSPTLGGNSTGSNLVYYDFDTVNDRFIVTWDDVGYYSSHTDKLNAFQLILTNRGSGDFDIEFRYEDVNWTTGSASGGSGGLGGTVARAGYTAGTGDPAAFFELPASGNQADMLALDETAGNAGDMGRWEFKVRSGDVVTSNIPPLPPIGVNGWTVGDPHISTLDGVGYDFQAAGEFVMLRGVADPSFEIQARMVPIGNNVSVSSAVATNLGGVAVMVDAQDAIPLQIDGVATTINNFSSIGVGNDRIFREDNTYTIVYAGTDGIVNAGDSRLVVDVFSNRVDIDVRLNTDMAGDLEGLFGDGDGNPVNDIALADGTVLDRPLAFDVLYGQYRDDWRVSDIADSLFTYDGGESLDGFYLPAYPGALMTLDDLDPAVRASAEQAVLNAGLSRGTINFNNAVLDFALTGDSSYIVSSLGVPGISENNYVSVIPPVEIPVEIVRIGDAPLRVSRSDPDAWKDAWTNAKIDISHKANYLNTAENWSSAAFNGNNSSVLSGGDIFGGDLGISGQSLASSTIRQEIDGTEALRFDLGEAATKVTIDLSRLDGNSSSGHFDAGRLQLLDDTGLIVDELIFSADATSHEKEITLDHSSGFSAVVLTAGLYNGADFIYGGLADATGQYLSDPQDVGNGTWNASEYLVDAVEFEFGNITLVGIAA